MTRGNNHRDRLGVIVMGASAGGVDALSGAIAGLPADLAAAVLVVMHLSPRGKSVLPHILATRGRLRATHAVDGEALEPSRVYVAPPDRHLVVERGRVRVTNDPKENGVRPSVDTLFRSAANAYGPDVIGVVLSGMLDDGTAGLIAIKEHGGVAIAQDPEEAVFPGMPSSAVRFADPDHVVPLEKLAPLLVGILEERQHSGIVGDAVDATNEADRDDESGDGQPGQPSEFTCPECAGTLWEQPEGDLVRFRCRVGHAYSSESLLAEQRDALESTLWAAVVALEERADLAKRLSKRMHELGRPSSMGRFDREGDDARRRAALVREAIVHLSIPVDDEEGEARA